MKRRIAFVVLQIVILATSLAMLPYVGLPYTPLQVTGLRLDEYYGTPAPADPTQHIFLPLVVR